MVSQPQTTRLGEWEAQVVSLPQEKQENAHDLTEIKESKARLSDHPARAPESLHGLRGES